MSIYHTVEDVLVRDGKLSLVVDGKEHSFLIEEVSELLSSASEAELENFEVTPSGYGIHWPLLDEDISIDGLLGITHSPQDRDKNLENN